ncbi:hypothetical protein D3C78_1380090 [compost metagenome]
MNTPRIDQESRVALGSSAAGPPGVAAQFFSQCSRRVQATSAIRFASFHNGVPGTFQMVDTLMCAVSPTA